MKSEGQSREMHGELCNPCVLLPVWNSIFSANSNVFFCGFPRRGHVSSISAKKYVKLRLPWNSHFAEECLSPCVNSSTGSKTRVPSEALIVTHDLCIILQTAHPHPHAGEVCTHARHCLGGKIVGIENRLLVYFLSIVQPFPVKCIASTALCVHCACAQLPCNWLLYWDM